LGVFHKNQILGNGVRVFPEKEQVFGFWENDALIKKGKE
jgi:hypothetical protein